MYSCVYIYMQKMSDVLMYLHVWIHIDKCIHIYICINDVNIYDEWYINVCIDLYVYIYIYIYMYIYNHTNIYTYKTYIQICKWCMLYEYMYVNVYVPEYILHR
jgi:hypothetical protein